MEWKKARLRFERVVGWFGSLWRRYSVRHGGERWQGKRTNLWKGKRELSRWRSQA
jgi:hypothetical protein